jgi:hypothetical protein
LNFHCKKFKKKTHFPLKTSLFIFLCILREFPQQKIPSQLCGEGDPQQKIPRELCGEGDPAIFLHSSAPMERVFDGMDQENSKNTRRKKEWRKQKEEIFFHRSGGSNFPYSCVLHLSRTPLGYHPLSLQRTHSYENLTLQQKLLVKRPIKFVKLKQTLELSSNVFFWSIL